MATPSKPQSTSLATLYSRLGDVEKHQAESRVQIEALIGVTKDLGKKVEDLADVVSKKSQFTRSDFFSIIMVLIAVGGVMVAYVSMSMRPFTLSLGEIETQFRAGDQARNIQFSDQQRLNALMWNAMAQAGLKMPPYPNGPFFQPTISKEEHSEN